MFRTSDRSTVQLTIIECSFGKFYYVLKIYIGDYQNKLL